MYFQHPEIIRDYISLTCEDDIEDYFTDECMNWLSSDSEGVILLK